MIKGRGSSCAFPAVLLGLALSAVSATLAGRAKTEQPVPDLRDKILAFIRERFAIPAATKLTAEPLKEINPDFYEATITVENEKGKQNQPVYLSRDRQYIVMGNLYPLGSNPRTDIIKQVRETFKIAPTMQVAVSPFRNSVFAPFNLTTITADDGKQKQSQNFFVTKDGKFLVLGNIMALDADPRREIAHTIVTRNMPSIGPADAPVTIVEFADLECPSCAHIHDFIKKDLLPKYGNKIRVVFKEYPLIQIHDWSLMAAIANECAYQMDPRTFFPYRSIIFEHQSSINATNVRSVLLDYAEQAGIDRVRLAGCIDSKASIGRIEESTKEAQALSVSQTPTFFINGRLLVGAPSPEEFYKAVDQALKEAKAAENRRPQPSAARNSLAKKQ